MTRALHRHSFVGSAITLFAFGALAARCADVANGDVPSVETIRDAIQHAQRKLFADDQSIKIVYAREASEDVVPTKFSGGLLLAEWTLARGKPSEWYSELRFLQRHSGPEFVVPAEPRTHVFKDGLALDWTQHAKSCVISETTPLLNVSQGWDYLRDVGYDPYREIVESVRATWPNRTPDIDAQWLEREWSNGVLPNQLAKFGDQYRVSAEPEAIDGILCYRLSWNGVDDVWVAPTKGFAVVRRECTWGEGKPLRRTILNTDFREVKPGLWLPFAQTRNTYSDIESEEEGLWGELANKSTYRLKSVAFGDDVTGLFAIAVPSGTRVNDFTRNIEYTVSQNSSDPFAEPILEAENLLQPKGRHRWLVAVNGLMLVALLAYFARKWNRSRRPRH